MRQIKWITRILIGLAIAYATLCAGLYTAMCQPPERFGAIMSRVPNLAFLVLPFRPLWMQARAGSLNTGDPAPDFVLPTLDHRGTVSLSSEYVSKPVVLIFGSYT